MNITKVCSGWESGHSDNSHRTFDSSYDKVCVCDIDIPFGNNTKEYSKYSKLTINYKISFPKLFFFSNSSHIPYPQHCEFAWWPFME